MIFSVGLSALYASAAHSLAAQTVANAPPSVAPPSFNGDQSILVWNLFLMAAAFFLGAMMVARQGSRIWAQRLYDHPLDPVTLYRAITFFAGLGLTVRCGAEAMAIWGYNPVDPVTSARVLMAKRWLDPIAVVAGLTWLAIAILGEPGIEHQLRQRPLPLDRPQSVDMWSRWPVLTRACGIIILCFAAAVAVVILR